MYDILKAYLKYHRSPFLGSLFRQAQKVKRETEKTRMVRRVRRGDSSFITMEDLLHWTREWIRMFPSAYDVIVGVPRSGLLVAEIISLKLARPCSTPELLCERSYWKSKSMFRPGSIQSVLLVDDSINSGEQMKQSYDILNAGCPELRITTGALLAHEGSKNKVDLYYKIIPQPRFFEWNILHQKKIRKLAVSVDGFLCESRPEGLNPVDPEYRHWVNQAKPYMIPAYPIDFIVSNRLESHRADTEAWLFRHNVRYGKLFLRENPCEGDSSRTAGDYKVATLRKLDPDMYIGSSHDQAKRIWKETSILTLCTDEMVMFG